MRLYRHLSILLLVSLASYHADAQGCSDAGFCTMGAMKPDQNYSKRIAIKLRSIEFNYYKGTSLLTAVIQAATVDFNLGINDYSSFQIKLPYMWVSGNLGEVAGPGDISLSYTRQLKTYNGWVVNGTLGAKIPTGDSNETVNNEHTGGVDAPIHMYYQPSLGSYDAIAGISALSGKWLFATGIQVALTKNNNQFAWSGFPNYPDTEYLQSHDRGKELKRGIDVMFRVERNWRFTNFNFSLGALPIYRITKDEAIIPGTNERGKLPNTTGLALSVLGSFGYHFDVNNSVKIIKGIKVVDRDFNPDGLTRDEVVSVSYIYKF
ncbi:hypothetical protein [Ekhidna sp.]|uniref:hypothetical protein n=1 Tax=Ekhidna sp. TaxID=2608089 RepID=UPI003CCC09FC